MIKNNPSSKQENDLCKKTVMEYFGYFYHAEIGLFNPANGVGKKWIAVKEILNQH